MKQPERKGYTKMVKKDFIEIIAEKTGLNRVIVKKILDVFLQTVRSSLIAGERIEIRNLGVFSVKRRKAKGWISKYKRQV